MESRQFRQGDVLLIEVADIPPYADRVAREHGRIVLAHGEATGHTHALHESGCELYQRCNERYLQVTEENCILRHEEHHPITLPIGAYRVVRQREYVPTRSRFGQTATQGRSRYVAD